MKNILLLALGSILLNVAIAQPTITPSQNNEYCPGTEYTFTVTITKPYSSMIGVGGCFITQLPTLPVGTTFTFKGKFGDANQKQIFRIYHPDNTWTDFDFKKIKSLYYSATSTANPPCNVIKPNQVQPIIFPRCQVTSATISFPNIQWFTTFENPEICFGSVTDYEYLLPTGWKLGTTTSNGSTWIEGGNSVTVTSDLSTGDGSDIRIRASNKTCGTGLAANGPVSTVRISRPEPTLSITGTQDHICSGSANFTINGMPSGATVQWSSSNTNLAQVTSGANSPTVILSRVGSNNGEITLIATVTHCTFTYSVNKAIAIGAGAPPNIWIRNWDRNCGSFAEAYCTNPAASTGFVWNLNFGQVIQNNPGYYGNYFYVSPLVNNPQVGLTYYNYLTVQSTNACGTSDPSVTVRMDVGPVPPECGNGGPILLVSLNPTGSTLNVETKNNKGFTQLRIFDKMGNLKKQFSYPSGTKRTSINVGNLPSDIYRIQVYDGNKWITTSFIKQ